MLYKVLILKIMCHQKGRSMDQNQISKKSEIYIRYKIKVGILRKEKEYVQSYWFFHLLGMHVDFSLSSFTEV